MSLENPQLEDGYLKIVLSVVEALARTQLSGYEWRVLLFLLRKTYGWNKRSDIISLSQFTDGTRLDRRHVARTIRHLVEKRMITIDSANLGTSKMSTYTFNKHFGEWVASAKLGTPSANLGPKGSANLGTHNINSYNRKKDIVEQQPLDPPPPEAKPKRKSKDTVPEVLDVLAYLNLKIGSKYSVAPDLVARFKQGSTVDQAKAIIDKKVAEWVGTEMAPWLKPSTLLCKKHFDEYLNQPGVSAVKLAIPIPIWTEEQDAKHKEHARRWINDDSKKEEAR